MGLFVRECEILEEEDANVRRIVTALIDPSHIFILTCTTSKYTNPPCSSPFPSSHFEKFLENTFLRSHFPYLDKLVVWRNCLNFGAATQ